MSSNFDGQAEDEGNWVEPPRPEGTPPTARQRWRLPALLLVLVLLVGGALLYAVPAAH